jgi:hypothetical protein
MSENDEEIRRDKVEIDEAKRHLIEDEARVAEDREELEEAEHQLREDQKHHSEVTIHVNRAPVVMPSHGATGMEIKLAAIAQGVDIKVDFHLTLEAHSGEGAREIADDERIPLTEHSVFSACDGDDDS